MEKLIYVLGADDGADIGALADSLRREVVGQLKSAGACNIRLCIDFCDDETSLHILPGKYGLLYPVQYTMVP